MEAVLAAAFGVAIGVAIGALGGGGSVLAVPVLVYVLSEPVHDATTASLLVVAAAGVSGGLTQNRAGLVCWNCILLLSLSAAAGSLAGSGLNAVASGTVILVAFAPVLAVAGAAIWRSGKAAAAESATCPHIETLPGLSAGLAVGILIGFFGVGGGFLVVPLLVFLLGFPLGRAVATSIVVVGIVSMLSLGAHLLTGGGFDLPITAGMAIGAAAGALVGARLGPVLPRLYLARTFAMLVFVVAGWLLASVIFLGGPPSG